MDIREFLNYLKKMKWVIIVPLIICILLSGFFTYFNKVTYNSTFTIVIGPQSVIGKDGKFRTNLAFVLADLLGNEKVAAQVAKETGMSVDKYALKGMVGLVVDDQHQKIDMTVSGADKESVSTLASKLPGIIVNSANQLFYVDNLLVLGNDGKIVVTGRNYKRNMAAGAVGGLGIGFLAVFIMLIFDDRLRDRKGLKRLLGIDYLGIIDKSADSKESGQDNLSVLTARLLLKADKSSSKIISNLGMNTGKNSDSILKIGRNIADLNRKVLMINMDKTSAAIDSMIKGNMGYGFSDMLKHKETDYSKSVYETGNKNLYIIPFGSEENMDLSSLMSPEFKKFIEKTRESYDMVLLNLSDAIGMEKILASSYMCDGTVLSVKEGSVKVKDAEEVINSLKDTGINVLGYYTV